MRKTALRPAIVLCSSALALLSLAGCDVEDVLNEVISTPSSSSSYGSSSPGYGGSSYGYNGEPPAYGGGYDNGYGGNGNGNAYIGGRRSSRGIRILEAYYGVGRDSVDVREEVQSYSEGNRLKMRVTNPNLGIDRQNDPAPGEGKTLYVTYQTSEGTQSTQVGENDTLLITDY